MLKAELRIHSGKQKGKAIRLSKKKKFLVGRGEDCHLRPNSDLVSRHHCVFQVDDYSLRIKDLGSTNGTFVNDVLIKGQVELNSGDLVKIGKLKFLVAIETLEDNQAPESSGSQELPISEIVEPSASAGSETIVALPTEQHNETTILSNQETITGMPTFAPEEPLQQPAMPQQQPQGQIPPPPQQFPPGTYPPGTYPPPPYGYPPQQSGQYPVPPQQIPGQPPQYPYPYPYPYQQQYPQGVMPPMQHQPTQVEMPLIPEAEPGLLPPDSNPEVQTTKELPLRLPDPSDTGVSAEEEAARKAAKKKKSAASPESEEASPSTTAADILKQMSRRKPSSS